MGPANASLEKLKCNISESPQKSLADQLKEALFPSEEGLYLSHFKRDYWSLDEFCALMGGLSLEKYKKIIKNIDDETLPAIDLKRCLDSNKICTRFFKQIEEIRLNGKIQMSEGNFYMTPWRFIKWIASNDIPVKRRFLEALPLYLTKLYLEFIPANSPLQTKTKSSLSRSALPKKCSRSNGQILF